MSVLEPAHLTSQCLMPLICLCNVVSNVAMQYTLYAATGTHPSLIVTLNSLLMDTPNSGLLPIMDELSCPAKFTIDIEHLLFLDNEQGELH